jgi:L-threonylcarbamoyladenylate synthase
MNDLAGVLTSGGTAVLATDTIYGLVARAADKQAVERLYRIKGRTPTKPFIILISDIAQVEQFGADLNKFTKEVCDTYWPGPVSIIMPTNDDNFAYLHRGSNSLAFRLPAKPNLVNLIKHSGPLVAPSANPEGLLPATNIEKAKEYFGNSVDVYVDEGEVIGTPSKIINIVDGKEKIIRN